MNSIWSIFWRSILASTLLLWGQAEGRQHTDFTITDTNKIESVINCIQIVIHTELWSFTTGIEFCKRVDTLLRTNTVTKEISFIKRWEQALPVVNNMNVFLNCFNQVLVTTPNPIVNIYWIYWQSIRGMNLEQLKVNAIVAAEKCSLK